MNTQPSSLVRQLASNWHMLLIRGLLSVLFGVIALWWSLAAMLAIVMVYGAYVLVDGVFSLAAALGKSSGGYGPRWWLVLVGALGVLAGLFLLMDPGFGAAILVICLGVWAICRGVFEFIGAMRLRHEVASHGWLVLDSVLSVLFGVLILAWPLAGAVALTWGLGLFALVTGLCQVVLAFRLRRYKDA